MHLQSISILIGKKSKVNEKLKPYPVKYIKK